MYEVKNLTVEAGTAQKMLFLFLI